jgi:HK97 family phage prohead protease
MQTAVLEKVAFSFPVDILKQTEEQGEFHVVGYAATTDFDLQGDVISEEALRGAADDLVKNSTVLLNHDLKRPIGKVTKATFDKNGLLIDALISKTEQEIIQKIKEGILNKFSVRGQVLERERKFMPELNRMANFISKVSLIEVSLVSIPANPEARAIGWYVSKALEETDRKSQGTLSPGGNPMPQDVVVEEITPKPGEPAPESPRTEEPKPAVDAPKPEAPAAPPAQRPEEIQKSIVAAVKAQFASVYMTKAEVEKMISAEVQKQVESALKAVPTLRKGLIQQDPDVDQLKKTFEGLPPEKKLKVALALQQG